MRIAITPLFNFIKKYYKENCFEVNLVARILVIQWHLITLLNFFFSRKHLPTSEVTFMASFYSSCSLQAKVYITTSFPMPRHFADVTR
jgi:hypothetical protein